MKEVQPVLVVALDDLMVWEGLDRLDYLKIDVEGAEHQVLLGAKKTIEKFRPIIQMEVSIRDVGVDLPDYSAFNSPQCQGYPTNIGGQSRSFQGTTTDQADVNPDSKPSAKIGVPPSRVCQAPRP